MPTSGGPDSGGYWVPWTTGSNTSEEETTAPYTTEPETTVPETTVDDGSSGWEYDVYFDYEQTYKPTETQINSLTWNMSITDVVNLIGKPHKIGPHSGLTTLVWETDEGHWYYVIVSVSSKDAEDIPLWEALLTRGVCSAAIYSDLLN